MSIAAVHLIFKSPDFENSLSRTFNLRAVFLKSFSLFLPFAVFGHDYMEEFFSIQLLFLDMITWRNFSQFLFLFSPLAVFRQVYMEEFFSIPLFTFSPCLFLDMITWRRRRGFEDCNQSEFARQLLKSGTFRIPHFPTMSERLWMTYTSLQALGRE